MASQTKNKLPLKWDNLADEYDFRIQCQGMK